MVVADVMTDILKAFQSGQTVKVHIQFGTLQGHFLVEEIEPTQREEDWIFHGGNFHLKTGRYTLHTTSQTPTGMQYVFASKVTMHPKKTIIFEIIG